MIVTLNYSQAVLSFLNGLHVCNKRFEILFPCYKQLWSTIRCLLVAMTYVSESTTIFLQREGTHRAGSRIKRYRFLKWSSLWHFPCSYLKIQMRSRKAAIHPWVTDLRLERLEMITKHHLLIWGSRDLWHYIKNLS